MPFISFNVRSHKKQRKKLPPPSAWGHYRIRREKTAAGKYMSAESRTLISVNSLSLGYGGKDVVKDLTFEVREGDYLSVIGDNGSGKSTLLSALLRLKSQSGGEIDFTDLEKNEIGFLPQQNEARRDFPVTVFEVVMSGCLDRSSHGPILTRVSRDIAFSNMEKMGVTSLAKNTFGTLSGGQRQRVMLARALCSAKRLLVLDEPVTGLDPKTVADIYSLVSYLNREKGMTVICVTHDIPSALKFSSHILRLGSDNHFFGTVEEYLALDEAKKYVGSDKSAADAPYGEGGFRYNGGTA